MNKKKKILIILIILLITLVSILLLRVLLEKKQEENKQYNTIEDFETPQDVVRYLGGEFIKQEESKETDFKVDVYLKFKVAPYTGDVSNKEYYNQLIDMISYCLDYNSFRLIDDEKELLIAVICDSQNGRIKRKYINGDYNYFGNKESQRELSKIEKIEITNLEIQAPKILEIINNGWNTSTVEFGLQTGKRGKYDVYEEGIEVRNVYKKVFNIVFNANYTEPVINGITTNMTEEEIIGILGKPTITSKNTEIFGYKGKEIYVFFAYGDISIYRVDGFNSTEFAKLVENYINGTDVKTFVSSITDIWPDYDKYEYDENYINLVYTLKGIKIQFNITSNHGIIVHNNYTGQILEGVTLENVNTDELKNKVFFENTNTMLENEIVRANYYEANPS